MFKKLHRDVFVRVLIIRIISIIHTWNNRNDKYKVTNALDKPA